MIIGGYLPEPPLTREQRIEAAEDRAGQAGRLRTCTICRTSLDECPVECPHGLPFCEHCTWEEGCDECLIEPLRQRAAVAWEAASTPGAWERPTPEVDAAAENHKTERQYADHQLQDREEAR